MYIINTNKLYKYDSRFLLADFSIQFVSFTRGIVFFFIALYNKINYYITIS